MNELQRAAASGDFDVVERLLEQGVDPNSGHDPRGPLVRACEGGHIEVVRLLLARGADPHRLDSSGKTPAERLAFMGLSQESHDALADMFRQRKTWVSRLRGATALLSGGDWRAPGWAFAATGWLLALLLSALLLLDQGPGPVEQPASNILDTAPSQSQSPELTLPDPEQEMGLLAQLDRARGYLDEGQPEAALRTVEAVLRRCRKQKWQAPPGAHLLFSEALAAVRKQKQVETGKIEAAPEVAPEERTVEIEPSPSVAIPLKLPSASYPKAKKSDSRRSLRPYPSPVPPGPKAPPHPQPSDRVFVPKQPGGARPQPPRSPMPGGRGPGHPPPPGSRPGQAPPPPPGFPPPPPGAPRHQNWERPPAPPGYNEPIQERRPPGY